MSCTRLTAPDGVQTIWLGTRPIDNDEELDALYCFMRDSTVMRNGQYPVIRSFRQKASNPPLLANVELAGIEAMRSLDTLSSRTSSCVAATSIHGIVAGTLRKIERPL
jgi:hypothetical protein